MVSLFGELAKKVTVRHILTMRSGLADFEQGDFDLDLLENTPNITHSPLENLQVVSNFSAPDFCTT
jgi:CubicO group peptidase (beta-lactamase class C family)